MTSDEVCVRTYLSRTEALVAKSFLESIGIAARIMADDSGGVMPHLSFSNGVELRVRSLDAKRAIEALDEVEGQESS